MKISIKTIMVGTGAKQEVAQQWQSAIQSACDKYDISNRRRVAMFLANVGVECASLTKLVENLNYSAERMAVVWPSRFLTLDKDGNKVPNELAYKLQRNPEALANNVYANRMGNRDESSGDGWKYRGQGPIMITGRENISNCAKAIGMDLVNQPELLQEPEAGALSAAWFWSRRELNRAADLDMFSQSVKKINGALPSEANHGELRRQRYRDCLKQIDSEA